MNITGTKIREAIAVWTVRREAYAKVFQSELTTFKGEHKQPFETAKKLLECDLAIARLQAVQQHYNTKVVVSALGERGTLAYWVKALGGYERMASEWKNVVKGGQPRYWRNDSDPAIRKEGEERAQPTVTPAQAGKEAAQAMKQAAEIRAAIAKANQTEENFELPPQLFE